MNEFRMHGGHNKYGFNKLKVEGSTEVEGRFNYVRSSAHNYGTRHNMLFEVVKIGSVEFSSHCKILIKRIK